MVEQQMGIQLPYLVSNGMVLQREQINKIWGWATANQMLTVEFIGKRYETQVNGDGRWEIELDQLHAGGPYTMTISCAGSSRSITDILAGEVWVLGGQSNMELPVNRTLDLYEDEVKKDSDYSQIRKFCVPLEYEFHQPVDELKGGVWEALSPDTAGEFSAIGYFLAKELYHRYRIPIGLIHASWGGTPAQAWMSEDSLMKFGRFQELLSLCKDDTYVNDSITRDQQNAADWNRMLDIKDNGLLDEKTLWYLPECDDTAWNGIEVPFNFQGTELETLRGSVWFRREFFLSEELAGKEAKLSLGTIIDADTTYLNGVLVGNTPYKYPPRRYQIPEGVLKAGRNVLAVRVVVSLGCGAFITDMPYFIQIGKEKISLTGIWKYRTGATTTALEPQQFFHNKPTGLYNAMIYPLRKYSIRGVLWYQGESNDPYPYDYKELFEAVIKDWRSLWKLGDFPFYYVQIANFCPWKQESKVSSWARLRDEQRQAMEIPATGMVVTCDIGEYNDLHPQDKKTVALRLARWIRRDIFSEDIEPCGPMIDRVVREGDRLRLYFTHIGGGLMAKHGELQTFMISGTDGVYYEARAEVDQNTILVYQAEQVHDRKIRNPVSVRYAWSDNPEGANLYNKEGLPASPFMIK
jgi:sialate O-acetylesterase